MKKTPENHACGNHVATTQPTCSDNLITRIKTLRFIPTLMTTEMVGATMAGRKTMTRRTKGLDLVNSEPDLHTFLRMQEYPDGSWRAIFQSDDSDEPGSIICPYGKPGDLLWIREAFQHVDIPDDFTGYVYKIPVGKDWELSNDMWTWKPGIHMPKEACRLFLLIKNISIERLHDITDQDAVAEGIKPVESFDSGEGKPTQQMYKNYLPTGYMEVRPLASFISLWTKINGKESWERNPWVWVISFEQASIKFVPELNKELCARPATKK